MAPPQHFSACASVSRRAPTGRPQHPLDFTMSNAPNQKGPNTKKKQKCKNCEGKGLLKKGDKVVTCQRCKGTGLR
jgi:DnaJ-class molecular chaperone